MVVERSVYLEICYFWSEKYLFRLIRDIFLTKVILIISESIMLTGVTSNNRKIIVAVNLRGFFG